MYEKSKDFKGWRKKWLSWLRRHTRMVGALLRGTPAVAAFAGVLYLGFTIATMRKDELVGRYLDRAEHGLRSGEYRAARIGYERLTQLEPSRRQFRFGLALSLFALNDFQPAVGLMQGLAPVNEQGFVWAHLWQADRLMRGAPSKAERDLAKTHLVWVLQEQPNEPDANALMASVHIGDGRLDRAKYYLLKCCKAHPEMELALARVYAAESATEPNKDTAKQLKESAKLHGDLSFLYYKGLLKADASNHTARLGLAEAALFLGQHETAQEVLEAGLQATGDMGFRLALSRVYFRHAMYLANDSRTDLGLRMDLLQKAVEFDFSNLDAIQALLSFTKLKGPEAARARAALNKLLAEGKSPAVIHMIRGLEAQDQGDMKKARVHFEQAYQLEPSMIVVVNNLAWSLAHVEPLDLARALSLINVVLERAPKQANFRETRGQIYAKLKRWKEAVADLEFALPSMSKSRAVRETLAEAYKQLDVPEMEQEHRRILAGLPK